MIDSLEKKNMYNNAALIGGSYNTAALNGGFSFDDEDITPFNALAKERFDVSDDPYDDEVDDVGDLEGGWSTTLNGVAFDPADPLAFIKGPNGTIDPNRIAFIGQSLVNAPNGINTLPTGAQKKIWRTAAMMAGYSSIPAARVRRGRGANATYVPNPKRIELGNAINVNLAIAFILDTIIYHMKLLQAESRRLGSYRDASGPDLARKREIARRIRNLKIEYNKLIDFIPQIPMGYGDIRIVKAIQDAIRINTDPTDRSHVGPYITSESKQKWARDRGYNNAQFKSRAELRDFGMQQIGNQTYPYGRRTLYSRLALQRKGLGKKINITRRRRTNAAAAAAAAAAAPVVKSMQIG